MRFLDLKGQVFGRWTVLSLISMCPTRFLCRCECGTVRVVASTSLQQRVSTSCGCYQRENAARYRTLSLDKRFWRLVDKDGPMPTVCDSTFGNCWLWLGARQNKEHGRATTRVTIDGITTSRQVTHIAWFIEHGCWPEYNVCHVCDSPLCVRPSHLFDADQSANMYDSYVKRHGGSLIAVNQ